MTFRPFWSQDDDKNGRQLPANACCHQRSAAVHEIGARVGRLPNGEKCCEYAVEPTNFSMDNVEDKGLADFTSSLNYFQCFEGGPKGPASYLMTKPSEFQMIQDWLVTW